MAEETLDETAPERWSAAKVYEDMWVDPDDDPRSRGTAQTSGRC